MLKECLFSAIIGFNTQNDKTKKMFIGQERVTQGQHGIKERRARPLRD